MALQTVTDDGHFTWECAKCGQHRAAHVSHDEVVFHQPKGRPVHHRVVQLPICDCGGRTDLKVDFTSAELHAPNMIDENGDTTPSYMTAQRHIALVKHMRAAGKSESNDASIALE